MRWRLAPLVVVLLVLVMVPPRGSGLDVPTEGDLTVEGYYADAFRPDDHRSLTVSEMHFFNNTGDEPFSGNLTFWFQKDAYISSLYCGSFRNRVAIVDGGVSVRCVDLQQESDEVFKLWPFDDGGFLSFFGETHTIPLNVTSQAAPGSGELPFDATIGLPGATPAEVDVGNVTIRASNTALGAYTPTNEWGPSRNLTLEQSVVFENTGGEDEVLNLSIRDVPAGWTAALWNGVQEVSQVTVPAGQDRALVFNVTAPSNILFVLADYALQGTELSSGNHAVTLEKVFPYNTTQVSLRVYALDRDEVDVTGELVEIPHPTWSDNFERFTIDVRGRRAPRGGVFAGEETTVTVTWVPPPFSVPPWAIAAIAALGVALVLYTVWQRRRRVRERESQDREDGSPAVKPMTAKEMRERRDLLRKTVERLSSEETKAGDGADLHAGLRAETEAELADVEHRLSLLTSAEGKKRQVLRAIRDLDQDLKAGKVDADVHASLKEKYEQEAVKAMRQIDKARGIQSQEGSDD